MYWPKVVVDNILEQVDGPYHVDDMKTPSGKVHVGSLRGVIIHDVVHKELLKAGVDSVYTYIYNDMDPMNKIPGYFEGAGYEEELGKPLFRVRSPDPEKSSSYADYFSQQFTEDFNTLGSYPEIIYSSDLYKSGKFDGVIREVLDKVEDIREVYAEVAGYDKPEDWYPLQVICPECGKVGTTLVTGWDGEKVQVECKEDLVPWARGCGFTGAVSPFGGNAKLMWKVDWPAHWKVLGVNIEGAGKDHTSAGGSRDMAREICKVLDVREPLDIPYEFILTGEGRKMSTSKAMGMMARDLVQVLPPEVARFLILRTHYNTAILFDPYGDTFLDLFDEFDRCARAYYTQDPEEDARASYFEAALIRPHFKEEVFLPRFRDIVTYVQMPSVDLKAWASEEKGSSLTPQEEQILEERVEYAEKWLREFAPEEFKFGFKEEIPDEVWDLTPEQNAFLAKLSEKMGSFQDTPSGEDLQQEIYNVAKDVSEVKVKDAFKSLYTILIGKDHGPRAGWLVADIGLPLVKARIEAVLENPEKS